MNRRLYSYWQGDRAQKLAAYILSSFAVVNEVDRENDFGLDFICSLIHKDGNLVFVERTFGLQVKSDPPAGLSFGGVDTDGKSWKGHEVEWLFNQDVPYFLGFVNRASRTLSVYSTCRLWGARWLAGKPFELFLEPDGETINDGTNAGLKKEEVAGLNLTNGEMPLDHCKWTIPLGGPIATICQDSIETQEPNGGMPMEMFAKTMASWIDLERKNIYHQKLNIPFSTEFRHWEPNIPPDDSQTNKVSTAYGNTTEDQNIHAVLDSIWPGVIALAGNWHLQHQFEKVLTIEPLAEAFEAYGKTEPQLKQWIREAKEALGKTSAP